MKTEFKKDSHGKLYKMYNNTCYHSKTPNELISVLDTCRENDFHVRIYFGDVKTGKVWNEEHDTIGRIGRSTGNMKIPLMCHFLAYGGPALLDHCILKIVNIRNKRVLYQHPKFVQPVVTIEPGNKPFPYNVMINGELFGCVDTERKAKLLKTRMR